ncbi:MAG: hypothetical protein COA38_19525 [Fluviicola sp.]|nr:MAG: hypothetical protein COA38_19525 [Fluviicola sp.]
MSTTNGELTKTVETNTEPTIKVNASAIIILSYKKNNEPKDLFIAGLKFTSGSGFSIMDGVPATLYISNLIEWVGGVEAMKALLPESGIKTKMVQRIEQFAGSDYRLELNAINIDNLNGVVDLEIKIPGMSVTTSELGLPNFKGLEFRVEEAILKVERKVEVIPG